MAEIGRMGAAANQIVAMYNWWQRVSTPAGVAVPQYVFRIDQDAVLRIADATSTGEVALLRSGMTDPKVSATGSSLGGHLAMAFAALFPDDVDQAVAFNSPGFADRAAVHTLFADLGGRTPMPGEGRIVNVLASEVNNAGDQHDILAGYPSDNFPGRLVTVPIENQFSTDVPDAKRYSWNHDQRQITDSLAVFNLLHQLDPSLTLERFDLLLRSSAPGENRSLENLVDAVQSFLGIDALPLPAGNAHRDALHAAIQSISGGATAAPDAHYLALAGRMRVAPVDAHTAALAREDFGALVALQALTPMVIAARSPSDTATQSALQNLWQTTRGEAYAAWQADQGRPEGGAWSREWREDRALLVQALEQRNAAGQAVTILADGRHPVDRVTALHFTDADDGLAKSLLVWNPADNPLNQALTSRPRQLVAFGDSGANRLEGTPGPLGDHLYGEAGDDILIGLAGNDHLEGGPGDDQYVFSAAFGVDTLSDVDGRGSILLDGQRLTGGTGSGIANLWLGADAAGQLTRYVVRDSRVSATGKQLIIARAGDPFNTVTVDHFDLAAASSDAGYLGIRLDARQSLVVAQAGQGSPGAVAGTSPFQAWGFDPDTFTGQTRIVEGGASLHTVFLRAAARAGDTITLALSGLQDRLQAWIGRSLVAASGAVIPLEAGQTQVVFALVQQGAVAASESAVLSATFTDSGGATVSSNAWALQLEDSGTIGQTLSGDQSYLLRTSTSALLRGEQVVVQPGGQAFRADSQGNLLPGDGPLVFDNVLFGGAGADRLQGLLGHDALDGGAGNDELLGGDGDDLIAGGPGHNFLVGGAGNDFLLGSGSLDPGLQWLGPEERWLAPSDRPVLARGATWGVYTDVDGLPVWHGASTAGDSPDGSTIDAGDGNDHVIAGAGDDRILGGAGDDHLDGMGGSDVIDAGDGDDTVRADGIVLAGYLNSTQPERHGADHVDAGPGQDWVQGGGGGDRLWGGAGDDQLFGDTGGPADSPYFVPLAWHGADFLSGDAGNDYLEGGGGDDVLQGGAGADTLWGDMPAAHLASLAPDSQWLAWGDDLLDGGEGDDTLIGGGGDDRLDGGEGDDVLRGDESSAALAGVFHGQDHLDGGPGHDLLVGGGQRDILRGGDGDDTLHGDDALSVLDGIWHGDDELDGGAGADVLVGGGGDDVLFGGSGNDWLHGDFAGPDAAGTAFDGADHLDGEDGDDRLFGGGGSDVLKGGAGNDWLDGGTGADHMEGGSGDDHYVVDHAGDRVFEREGGGTDTVTSSVAIRLPDHVEHLILVGPEALEASGNDADNRMTGNGAANLLRGGAGNDRLDGGAGADTLVGGPGDDHFEVDDPGDTVVELAGEGEDTVVTRVHFRLPDHVEHLVAQGTDDLQLQGNGLVNRLQGNAGNNLLHGGPGDDLLQGGGGDDVYVFLRGDGRDTLDNTDLLRDTADPARRPAFDTLRLGPGIRASDIVGMRAGDAAILQLRDTADAIVIADYFAPERIEGTRVLDHRIDRVEFDADPAWDAAMIGQVLARHDSNRAPVATGTLPVLQARVGEAFSFTVAAGTIVDPDPWDSVRYSLRLADGSALPGWLAFDDASRTLTAMPVAGAVGALGLELRGTDMYGQARGLAVTLQVADPVQRGTEGADTLIGSSLNDILLGLGGNDTLHAMGGSDLLDGGAGDDQLWADVGSGNAILIGGPGQDVLRGGGLADTYRFAPGDGRDTIIEQADAPGVLDRLEFGPGIAPADILARCVGADLVLAHIHGQDQITVAGWFTLAAPRVERIHFADQSVWTSEALTAAALVVDGTAGDDSIFGTELNDTLRGFAGNDSLHGGNGSDLLDGGDGHDLLTVGAGAVRSLLLGGAGNDRMEAALGARDTVFEGGPGDDDLRGSGHRDVYRFAAGDGQDTIRESEASPQAGASDRLEFGAGVAPDDLVVWRNGNDLLFSHRNGLDQVTVSDWFASTASFSSTARRIETVVFADGSSWAGADLSAAALVVHGTPGPDLLGGSDMDDTLYGLGGNDRISGGRGRNILHGGEGDDLLIADDGKFTVVSFAGMFPVVRDYWASNRLLGGPGNDTLWATALARGTVHEGGPGDDTLIGSGYNDTYLFGLGDGHDTLTEAAPVAGFVDQIRFGPGIAPGDIRVERAGSELLLAHANGQDRITLTGWFAGTGQRIESVVFDGGTEWTEAQLMAALPVELSGTAGPDVLVGTPGADDLRGLAGNDVLSGLAGPDRLHGGAGNDRLSGGDGDDYLSGDDPHEVAVAEHITSLVVHARGTVCEGIWPTMEVWLAGTRLHAVSVGSIGWAAYAVPLPPGTSAHSVDIVFTNDAYRPDIGQDRNLYVDRIEVNGRSVSASGAGTVLDFGAGAAAFDGRNTTLGLGALTSVGALRIGLQGGDLLDGGAGADTLVGGIGNDLYLVDNPADTVVEAASAGHDIVRATVDYTLPDHVEDLELGGTLALRGTGNALDNTLRGNAAANWLDGGAGADLLVGGAGDDTYAVDHPGDRIHEVAGGGTDTVRSSVSFVLGPEVEHLILTGDAPVNGTGNSQDNLLRGNAAANVLSGGAGHDTLEGGAGSDRLLGGDGDDWLLGDAPGETGQDMPIDSLVVHARGTVCEGIWPIMEVWVAGVRQQTFSVQSPVFMPYVVALAPGTRASAVDIVFTNDAYRPDLGQDRNLYVDRIEVQGRAISASGAGSVLDFGTGAAAFDGFNTTLGAGLLSSHGALRIGLHGNDWLDGGKGADTMAGGFGADVYLVDHAADAVIEAAGGGHDIVRASVSYTLPDHVEDLELVGTQALHGTGNAQANTVRGNAAANRLDGGAGADLLVGGAGGDTYVLGRGAGADGIYEFDTTPGVIDTVEFGPDIAADQLWFRRTGNQLEVRVIGTGDRFSISGWYSAEAHRVEQFRAGDGRLLLDSQVHNLVDAMAAFAPPPMGQTSLPGAYREALAPVLAAQWQ